MSASSSVYVRVFYVSFIQDLGWLSRDVIAGVTIGIIVIPQGMSYALVRLYITVNLLPLTITLQLAGLTVEYGLYTSFVGVLIYCVREQFRFPSSLKTDLPIISSSRHRRMSLSE